MVKKRLSTPSADHERPLRRASSAPLSLICRRSLNEGEKNNTNIASLSHNQSSHKRKTMKKEKEEGEGEEQIGSEECSAREKLQRYRVEVAGSVWIPDSWDHEERLKEWVDPIALDCSLAPDGLLSARSALIHDCISTGESDPPRPLSIDPPRPPVITCSQ